MMQSRPTLRFSGIDGIECEEFVHSVRNYALSEGKSRDNDFLVDVATAGLVGDALRFYEMLEPSVQQSWDLFRRALLAHYPPMAAGPVAPMPRPYEEAADELPPTYSPRVVVPPVDALVSLDVPPPPTPIPFSGTCTGRVLVVVDGDSSLNRYVSLASFKPTQNTLEALRVEVISDEQPATMKMLNSTSKRGCLGVAWPMTSPAFGQGSTDFSFLMSCSDSTTKLTSRASQWKGPVQSAIWNVTADRSLKLTCLDNSHQPHTMHVLLRPQNGADIYICSDPDAFITKYKDATYHKARLVIMQSTW